MKTAKTLRRKAGKPAAKPAAKKPPAKPPKKKQLTYSTSEGRANFAEALETAHSENAFVGFDRYGQLVAALAPIDAIRILAGRGGEVAPAVRDKITRLARLFLQDVPKQEPARAKRPV